MNFSAKLRFYFHVSKAYRHFFFQLSFFNHNSLPSFNNSLYFSTSKIKIYPKRIQQKIYPKRIQQKRYSKRIQQYEQRIITMDR